VFKFWRSRKLKSVPAASSVGDRVVYAIGDIHGRIDVLDVLLERIRSDVLESKPAERSSLVFLGDYIDRGPASRAVIDRVLELGAEFTVIALRGNHEDALIRFLEEPEGNTGWLDHGGIQTLLSYGVNPPQRADQPPWTDLRDRFAEALPDNHLSFFRQLEHYAVIGDFVFAHAGGRPEVALDKQSAHDLMWIRKPFLEADQALDRVVVHGHTPAEEPHMGRWRIGVDTGAYATGILTAVRLHGTDRSFISSRTRPVVQ
jgi:serine/threonine protein phosphatase 1